jgi:hypothetical protein
MAVFLSSLAGAGWQFLANTGVPLNGGKLYSYAAGTTTPQATYTSNTGATPNSNPITLLSTGRLPSDLWLTSGVSYKFVLKDATGVEIGTYDNIGAIGDNAAFLAAFSASSGSGLVGFLQAGTGAEARTVQAKLRDMICVFDFMSPAEIADVQAYTTSIDVTAKVQAAIAAANGRNLYFPAGRYRIAATLSNNRAPNAYLATFSSGLKIIGDGIYTQFDNRVANGPLFDIDSGNHGGSYEATMGSVLSGFTIISTIGPANSTGIRVLNGYEVTLEHLYIKGMSAHGIELRNGLYPDDGWNMLTMSNIWLDTCAGWGLKADGSSGRNEGSYTKLDHVFFQTNGTDATVESVTKANPAVVATTAAHGFANGAIVTIVGAQGMTQLNGNTYTVANATATTFELSGIDSTAYGTYTATPIKARVANKVPTSGGMIWKGQLLKMDQCAFANGNRNIGLFIKGDTGLGQGADLQQTTFENTYGKSLLVTGISQFKANQCKIYNNDAFPAFTGWDFDAAAYTIRQVEIDGIVVRATAGNTNYTAFKTSGGNADLTSMRVRNVTWDTFDYAGQSRFAGWQFDPIVNCGALYLPSATEVYFKPLTTDGAGGGFVPIGNTYPFRLRGGLGGSPSTSGEWVPRALSTGGLTLNLTGVAAGTAYYVYVYDNNAVPTLEYSATPFVSDATTGYPVKSGDATRYYVGRILGGGSANTVAISGTGYLNPTRLSGTQTGVPTYMWSDATGKVRISNSLPATDTSGTVIGTQV